ncbi:unnamed protein product [Brugia timori]|uniref:Secreted protein n=1 Tax=Brugia timori TaxID=42155 RepID=A0A0R3Q6A9_9BILA|nr:unnamed protein product [Brugia timori]
MNSLILFKTSKCFVLSLRLSPCTGKESKINTKSFGNSGRTMEVPLFKPGISGSLARLISTTGPDITSSAKVSKLSKPSMIFSFINLLTLFDASMLHTIESTECDTVPLVDGTWRRKR